MERNIEAFIFDLDGTLLDSLEDMADAGNAALVGHGFPAHPAEAYRFFIGNGTRMLMRRAAPEGTAEAVVETLLRDMHDNYAESWANKTRPYPGIMAMLEGLVARGFPLAVLSNKPHAFTTLCVRRFFPDIPFARVQGCPEQGKPKPDPALALDIARELGAAPARILFLGDSSVDMDTAGAAGMVRGAALWGFRPESELRDHGAEILLERPENIFDYT